MNRALRAPMPPSPSRRLQEARAARRLMATLTLLIMAISVVVLVSYQNAIRIPPSSGGPAQPAVLRIKNLGVTASVSAIRMNGAVLDPPEDPMTAGWWSDGALPGAATGSAVITAHKIHGGGGAFDDLAKVKRGDLVSLDTTTGVQNYAVSSVRNLTLDEFSAVAPALFRTDGRPRLVLITCWAWNGNGWDGNTVVIAEPKSA